MCANMSSKSNEEIVKEFKDYDEETARDIYHQVLTKLYESVSIGCVEKFEAKFKVIEYINSVKNQETLKAYYDSAPNSIRDTNLIILTCKYAKIGILYFLFGRGCNILKRFSDIIGNRTLSPNARDSTNHNCFYYAIRSSNVKLLDFLIKKWPSNIFADEQGYLNVIISKSYNELKLRNVFLFFEMQSYIERKLIDIGFFFNKSSQEEDDEEDSLIKVKARIDLMLDDIALLKKDYGNGLRVDAKFLYMAKCLAKNIHILKQQLKSTYDKVPWEEIEFCIICFILSLTKHNEINLHIRPVLNAKKILAHLENFSNCLKDQLKDLYKSNLTALPNQSREDVIKNITAKYPQMNELYKDYKQVRDVYSLEKIKKYINQAISADVKLKEGQLIIKRTLQVIIEHLKNNLLFPNLSFLTSHLLITSVSRNTREIITGLSDSLLHDNYLSKWTKFEKETDCALYEIIQNDLEKMSGLVTNILHLYKHKAVRFILKKFAESKDPAEVKEMIELFCWLDAQRTILRSYILLEQKTIEKLVNQLFILIPNKTLYEKFLFHEIMEIIELEKGQKRIKLLNNCGFQFLKHILKNNDNINLSIETFNFVKYLANEILECLDQKITPLNIEFISKSTKDIWSSARPRMKSDERNELDRLFLEIFHIVCFDSEKMEGIDELKVTFRAKEDEKRYLFAQGKLRSPGIREEGYYSQRLNLKLNTIKGILSCDGPGAALGNTDISDKKNMENQVLALETLILDVINILDSEPFTCNIYFLYEDFPLIAENQLAPDNEMMEALLLDPTLATIGVAEKIIEKNLGSNIIQNLVEVHPSTRRIQYYENFTKTALQDELFASLEVGDFIKVKDCLEKGADLFARSVNSWTTLHFAAKGNSLDIVKFILSKTMNAYIKDDNGRSALHIAAAYGRKHTVEYFVEEIQMSVDLVDDYGKTSLHVASLNGHLDVVKVLLKNKARMYCKDIFRYCPLHYAVQNNHMDVVKHLRELEVNLNDDEVNDAESLLTIAAEMGNLEMINYLLPDKETSEKCVANPNSETNLGLTPLHVAAILGNFDVAKALVSKGYEVNAKAWNGYLPLHYAVEKNHIEIVELLLENKEVYRNVIANSQQFEVLSIAVQNGNKEIVQVLLRYIDYPMHIKGNLKPTALHLAALNGHTEIISLLLKCGFNVNSKDNFGNTPLHNSCLHGYKYASLVLIDQKADVNIKNNKGMSSFHVAIKNDQWVVVKHMISNGASINEVSSESGTPLHLSAMYGTKIVCEFLFNFGAKIEARDVNMNSPLHVAAKKKDVGIVKLLLFGGADVNALNEDGFTPLHIAASCGHEEIVETLIERLPATALMQSDNIRTQCMFEKKDEIQSKSTKTSKFTRTSSDSSTIWIGRECFAIRKTDVINVINTSGFTCLCSAVTHNYETVVNVLLSKGADVNLGQPIAIAVSAGYENIVDILLRNKNIDISFHKQRVEASYSFICNCTLLHDAAQNGNIHIAEALLSKGIDVDHVRCEYGIERLKPYCSIPSDSRKSFYETALHIAAVNGHNNVVEVLLKNGVDCNRLNHEGNMPLELAIGGKHVQVVKTLLQCTGMEVIPWTCLYKAIMSGNRDIVQLLMEVKHKISQKYSNDEQPTHIAVKYGHLNILKYFLGNGYDIKDLGANSWTLMHYAAMGGSIEITSFLIEEKLDVNASDKFGKRPIHLAEEHGHTHMITLLLKNGALCDDLNLCDCDESWRLVKYVMDNNISEVKNCIKKELINSRYSNYFAVLKYASGKGFTKIVDILQNNKANPNIIEKSGFTPLHFSVMTDNFDIVKTLLSNGAIYNMVSECGRTCLNFAQDKDINDLLNLIDESFKGAQNFDLNFIDKLTNLKDESLVKAVMNACNLDGNSLIVFAIKNNFPKTEKLKQIFQDDIVNQIHNAQELSEKQNFNEALDILKKILDVRTEIFGPVNPSTIDIQMEIAEVYEEMLNYKRALEIFQEAHAKLVAVLGSSAKETVHTRSSIAFNLFKQQKWEEVLEVAKELYLFQKEVFGINAGNTLKTMSLISAALCNQGKIQEAIILSDSETYKDVLEMSITTYKKKKNLCRELHTGIWMDVNNIAMVLYKQHELNYSLDLLQNLFTWQKMMLGPDDLETLNTQCVIGDILYDQGKYIEAFETYTDVFDRRKRILGPKHPRVLDFSTKLKMLNVILKKNGTRGSEVTKSTQTCIFKAAASGDVKTVEELLNAGTAPDAVMPCKKQTPMHFAVYNCHLDVVNLLLKNGANVLKTTRKRNTVLHIATYKNSIEMVELFLLHVQKNYGEKLNEFVNARNTSGFTALHYAAKNNSFDNAKSLLKHGATYSLNNDTNSKVSPEYFLDQNFLDLLELVGEIFEYVQSDADSVVLEEIAIEDGDISRMGSEDMADRTASKNIHTIIEILLKRQTDGATFSPEIASESNNQEAERTKQEAKIIKRSPDALPFGDPQLTYRFHKAKAVIVNLNAYHSSMQDELSVRDASEHDVTNLQKTFQSMGFIEVEDPLITANKLNGLLCNLQKVSYGDFSEFDCFILVVIARKMEAGIIYGLHDEKIRIEDIWGLFTANKCPSLAGKPKLFFIQFCHGNDKGRGVYAEYPVDTLSVIEHIPVPVEPDMLLVVSTFAGTSSLRHGKGTPFILNLCAVLSEDNQKEEHLRKPILSLMTSVCRIQAAERDIKEEEVFGLSKGKFDEIQLSQRTPTIMFTLRKHFYFRESSY